MIHWSAEIKEIADKKYQMQRNIFLFDIIKRLFISLQNKKIKMDVADINERPYPVKKKRNTI
jgi:hypothetical protein